MEMTDILVIDPNENLNANATKVRIEAEIEDTEQIDRHSHGHHAGTMQMETQMAEEIATTKEKMAMVAGGEEQQQVAGIQTIWSVAET